MLTAVGAATVPVLLALVTGIAGVIVIYVGVNFVSCARSARSGWRKPRFRRRPSCACPAQAAGRQNRPWRYPVSTPSFLSQSILTAARVYFAMARDKLFSPGVAKVTDHAG